MVNGKVNGDQISFTAGGRKYSGRVQGDAMEGTSGANGKWKATRESRS